MALQVSTLFQFRVYRPQSCVDFVTAHGIVPSGAARGRLSFHDRPYQRVLYELVDEEGTDEIILQWCSQSGKSTGLLNVLQWHTVTRPSNSMVAFPNDRSRNDFVDDRLRIAIGQSPVWRAQLARVPDNIIQSKVRFVNKSLYLSLLGSEADLAQRDCELVAIDEADKQPATTGKESSPEKQITARTRTFRRAKRLFIGTPTIKDSPLDRGWKRSNQMRWTVKCPECGTEFFWTLHDLKWGERPVDPNGKKRSFIRHAEAIDAGEVEVYYQPPCGHKIAGKDMKDRLNRAGRAVALRPDVVRVAGMRVTAFDIPDESFESIACEFLRAKHDEEGGDERAMQHFFNHWLADTFYPRRVAIGDEAITSRVVRVPPGEVPRGFDFVTVGADVQDNRLYWIAAAWKAEPLCCHVIDFGCIRFGDGEETGADLHQMLTANLKVFGSVAANRVWRGPEFEGRARAVGIDSGDGEHRTLVYQFCLAAGRHCRPTKGERSPFTGGRLIRLSDKESDDHRGRLVLLCPVGISDQIASWYKSAAPDQPGARAGLTFCSAALEDKEFAEQMVSMERGKNGRWELRDGHAQDHYWDAMRGCIAMGAVCGVFRPRERKQKRRLVVRRPTSDAFGRR